MAQWVFRALGLRSYSGATINGNYLSELTFEFVYMPRRVVYPPGYSGTRLWAAKFTRSSSGEWKPVSTAHMGDLVCVCVCVCGVKMKQKDITQSRKFQMGEN